MASKYEKRLKKKYNIISHLFRIRFTREQGCDLRSDYTLVKKHRGRYQSVTSGDRDRPSKEPTAVPRRTTFHCVRAQGHSDTLEFRTGGTTCACSFWNFCPFLCAHCLRPRREETRLSRNYLQKCVESASCIDCRKTAGSTIQLSGVAEKNRRNNLTLGPSYMVGYSIIRETCVISSQRVNGKREGIFRFSGLGIQHSPSRDMSSRSERIGLSNLNAKEIRRDDSHRNLRRAYFTSPAVEGSVASTNMRIKRRIRSPKVARSRSYRDEIPWCHYALRNGVILADKYYVMMLSKMKNDNRSLTNWLIDTV